MIRWWLGERGYIPNIYKNSLVQKYKGVLKIISQMISQRNRHKKKHLIIGRGKPSTGMQKDSSFRERSKDTHSEKDWESAYICFKVNQTEHGNCITSTELPHINTDVRMVLRSFCEADTLVQAEVQMATCSLAPFVSGAFHFPLPNVKLCSPVH